MHRWELRLGPGSMRCIQTGVRGLAQRAARRVQCAVVTPKVRWSGWSSLDEDYLFVLSSLRFVVIDLRPVVSAAAMPASARHSFSRIATTVSTRGRAAPGDAASAHRPGQRHGRDVRNLSR